MYLICKCESQLAKNVLANNFPHNLQLVIAFLSGFGRRQFHHKGTAIDTAGYISWPGRNDPCWLRFVFVSEARDGGAGSLELGAGS